jgi:hypothetical protein
MDYVRMPTGYITVMSSTARATILAIVSQLNIKGGVNFHMQTYAESRIRKVVSSRIRGLPQPPASSGMLQDEQPISHTPLMLLGT